MNEVFGGSEEVLMEGEELERPEELKWLFILESGFGIFVFSLRCVIYVFYSGEIDAFCIVDFCDEVDGMKLGLWWFEVFVVNGI
jgi:hypothetical protein